MTDDAHHWLTLHRVRFPKAVSVSDSDFDAPARAECWRFCPSHGMNDKGLPLWSSETWGGLGIYETRADAEAMFADPGAHLPWLGQADEAWHALAIPIAHYGEVNWRGAVEDGTALRSGKAPAEGPMIVVTTAGYNSRSPDQIPRIAKFMADVQSVIEFYGTLPGNICRDVFNGGFDGRDGFTLSLWASDRDMIGAAYKPGRHKTYMDESRDGSVFDRSSFTRARLVDSRGKWDGADVPPAMVKHNI